MFFVFLYFIFQKYVVNLHPILKMWIDLGCLQPQKKMLKYKPEHYGLFAFRPNSLPINFINN